MAQNNFNDGTSGSVVIRTGPPASGGGSGGGFGGGGGVSGGFGKVSKSKQKARARAKAAHRQKQQQEQAEAAAQAQEAANQAQAAAQAQEQARQLAHRQFLAGLVQRYDAIRAEVDRRFAERAGQFAPALEQEIRAASTLSDPNHSERWQLYQISKQKSEIDGLITRKSADLNANAALASSFDGHDPLTRTSQDYVARLGQFGEAHDDGHRIWESAYTAAHEARLLSSQIHALREKSAAVARHHAEQTVVWRAREAVWEAQRQYAAQREARVRFKQQADEDARVSRTRQANTLTVPLSSMTHGAMVLTRSGALVAQQAGALIEAGVRQAVKHLPLAMLVPHPSTVLIGGLVYSPTLGDGELTPEQRRRLFQSVAVPARALGLSDEQALRSIADSGGSVEMPYRLKPEAVPQGTAVIAVTTGNEISASVPVINAVLDPLTGSYTAEVPGSPPRHLQFTPDASIAKEVPSQDRIALLPPVVQDLPKGVDLRIQDCIICVPGSAPMYLSFNLPPLGAGVVTGRGQPAKADWWNTASRSTGAAIPSQIGDQMRGGAKFSLSAHLATRCGGYWVSNLHSPINSMRSTKNASSKASPPMRRKTPGWASAASSNCAFRTMHQSARTRSISTGSASLRRKVPTDDVAFYLPSSLGRFLRLALEPGHLWCHRAANTSGRPPLRFPLRHPRLIPATRSSRSYRQTRRFRLLMKGRRVRVFRGSRGIWSCLRRMCCFWIVGMIRGLRREPGSRLREFGWETMPGPRGRLFQRKLLTS